MHKLMMAGLAISLLGGCATIIDGTEEDVKIATNPPGATAVADGHFTRTTPCSFSLLREDDHTIVVSMPGYKTVEVPIESSIGGTTFINILAGGIVGALIDAGTGSGNTLSPDDVVIDLQPGDGTVTWSIESGVPDEADRDETGPGTSLRPKP